MAGGAPSFMTTIRFLEKMDCTILSGHRRVRPFGLAGRRGVLFLLIDSKQP
jgi:N-methylhydantoinase B/oxoprolinase/acetone carboxylase alpha subunit